MQIEYKSSKDNYILHKIIIKQYTFTASNNNMYNYYI